MSTVVVKKNKVKQCKSQCLLSLCSFDKVFQVYEKEIVVDEAADSVTDSSTIINACISTNRQFLLIVHSGVEYLEVINMKAMQKFTINNLMKFSDFKTILSFNVHYDEKKPAKRLYILVETEFQIKLRAIQFEALFQNAPKQREKVLIQRKECFLCPKAQFKSDSPSIFFACYGKSLKFFKAATKENKLECENKNVELPQFFTSLFAEKKIFAFEQGQKTVGIIKCQPKQDLSFILVESLEGDSNSLKNNYIIFELNLFCNENEYLNIGYCSGYYIIQSTSKVWIIEEKNPDHLTSFDFNPIEGKLFLNFLIRNSENQMLMTMKKKQNGKNFLIDLLLSHETIIQSPKKKQRNTEVNDSPIKPLIAETLKKNLQTSQKKMKEQQKKNQQQNLQVPSKLNHLVSFGEPNPMFKSKNEEKKNDVSIVSFGQSNTSIQSVKVSFEGKKNPFEKKLVSSEKTEEKTEKTEKEQIDKKKEQQIRQQQEQKRKLEEFLQLKEQIMKLCSEFKNEIQDRVQSYEKCYKQSSFPEERIDKGEIISSSQVQQILKGQKLSYFCNFQLFQKRNLQLKEKLIQRNTQIQNQILIIAKWKQKLGWSQLIKGFKRKNFDQTKYIAERISDFRTQLTDLQLRLKERDPKKMEEKLHGSYPIFFINRRKNKKEKQTKNKKEGTKLRVLIPHDISIDQKEPLIKLKPLKP